MIKRICLAAVLAAILLAGHFLLFRDRAPNIVLIVVDTLRADHMGVYGYERDTTPRLDKFASENIKFNFAVSASSWTPASMASIFTALYPSAHGMMPPNTRVEASQKSKRLAEGLVTLAEALRDQGYRTAGVSTNPWLTKLFGFDQGFDVFLYIKRQSKADAVTAEGIRRIEELRKGKQPFFLWLHYMDPHSPYDPPREYRIYSGPLSRREYPKKQVKKISLYDGEIRHTDERIGELLDYLKRTGLYRDSIIVFTADHGEQFMERGRQGHGFHLHNEETHVPLIIRAGRDTQPQEIEGVVSTVDIFPTIFALAGLKWEKPMQGVSLQVFPVACPARYQALLGAPEPAYRRAVLSELRRHTNYKSVVDSDGKKLIVDYGMHSSLQVDPEEPGVSSSVFDSRRDYLELSALSDPALGLKLESELKDIYRQTLALRSQDTEGEIEMDEKTINDLKSLGYLK